MPPRLSLVPVFALCNLHSASQVSILAQKFHTSPPHKDENHYETLGLQPDASAASIKKQFYHLSRLHHPDHNPNDPSASTRFVKISSAYTVLGSPQSRERYDRDHIHIHSRHGQNASPRTAGSHSSHTANSTPFGSRPASGLSKRRSQFRGPPPSFYRNGGWGTQGGKRRAAAESTASSAGTSEGFSSSTSSAPSSSTADNMSGTDSGGGFGPGQSHPTRMGWTNDVPHFDRDGHYRTQEQQDARRRRRMEQETGVYERDTGDILLRFLGVGAIIMFAGAVPMMVGGFFEDTRGKRRKE
ncbi:MAG: hypothetical protein MMC33_000930 [Icmadophila ericetorum]|nr:hypothetical protein [Icmadophila ericetorum]